MIRGAGDYDVDYVRPGDWSHGWVGVSAASAMVFQPVSRVGGAAVGAAAIRDQAYQISPRAIDRSCAGTSQ